MGAGSQGNHVIRELELSAPLLTSGEGTGLEVELINNGQ